MNLSKIAMCAGVLLMYWFFVLVLNEGLPPGGGYGDQEGLLYLWWVVAFNKLHKIEI